MEEEKIQEKYIIHLEKLRMVPVFHLTFVSCIFIPWTQPQPAPKVQEKTVEDTEGERDRGGGEEKKSEREKNFMYIESLCCILGKKCLCILRLGVGKNTHPPHKLGNFKWYPHHITLASHRKGRYHLPQLLHSAQAR